MKRTRIKSRPIEASSKRARASWIRLASGLNSKISVTFAYTPYGVDMAKVRG